MASNVYYNFSKDLHTLFCSTRNKSIEDLFVRMAESIGDDFLNWFTNTNTARLNISSKVVGALRCAARMRNEYPHVTLTQISQYLLNNQSDITHLSTLQAMSKLVGDPRVSDVLSPISDILSVSGAWVFRTENGEPSPDLVDPSSIVDDLVRVKTAYNNYVTPPPVAKATKDGHPTINSLYSDDAVAPKQSKKEMIYSLFSDLLNKFTQELSSAASNGGKEALARHLSHGGIMKPMELEKFFSNHNFDLSFLGNDAKYVIKTIMKNLNAKTRTSEDAYDFIRNRALLRGHAIDDKTYRNFYMQKSMAGDFASMLGQNPSQPSTKENKITAKDSQLVQDDVLLFISLVLFGLHQHVI